MSDNEPNINWESLEYDISDFEFGSYLRSIRQAKKITIRSLAKAVKKTATYLSDIENGNNKPPNKELLEAIIEELNIDSNPKLKDNLYNLAAKGRKDIPADIKEFICDNDFVLLLIRKIKSHSINDEIIKQISNIIDGKDDKN